MSVFPLSRQDKRKLVFLVETDAKLIYSIQTMFPNYRIRHFSTFDAAIMSAKTGFPTVSLILANCELCQHEQNFLFQKAKQLLPQILFLVWSKKKLLGKKALKNGADAAISKPVDLGCLNDVMKELLLKGN